MTKMTYNAARQGETPGITFQASTLLGAKQRASRLLEAGAFSNQRITLVELVDVSGGLARTGRAWHKQYGRWTGE